MLQIRLHGRGGQGTVTAAEMLSLAAFEQGRHAQAFPSFGSERTGAPVVAFCRIAGREIRSREPVMAPDVLVVQDPTLLHQVDVFQGLKPDGWVLINSGRGLAELGLAELAARLPPGHAATVPASEIALARLGRPLPNAALLGGLAALAGIVSLEAVAQAIRDTFSGRVADANILAAADAHAWVLEHAAPAAPRPETEGAAPC
ncbi:2-oxoacid:acceptor oxidoreductase family protein [Rubrivivax gelatinosus]|uniref:Pyruvate ferredoxin oxidoreductase gamma subunit n=1 Tax=Rubrivivax gelatinosus TaxID=28068 RepID=A0A4R2MNI4_RUBGE|nr:2-oxoacid:acceptor oxidoreductase family protein [Rubrivivax gelatinosus]MBK1690476.1 2-oxoacid:acceptor oxidoreductase [Rubrivivax gelatinosus]TCP04646.1 pyruvate ferredoxin oxidoreductase gamma subunit [Rubrivivax gelatinosus]